MELGGWKTRLGGCRRSVVPCEAHRRRRTFHIPRVGEKDGRCARVVGMARGAAPSTYGTVAMTWRAEKPGLKVSVARQVAVVKVPLT